MNKKVKKINNCNTNILPWYYQKNMLSTTITKVSPGVRDNRPVTFASRVPPFLFLNNSTDNPINDEETIFLQILQLSNCLSGMHPKKLFIH
jgi:hypothetical protein